MDYGLGNGLVSGWMCNYLRINVDDGGIDCVYVVVGGAWGWL
jgi:hypothetical protein